MENPVKEVRCINCNKKLAEITLSDFIIASTASVRNDVTIKCPRCSIITAVSYGDLTKFASSAIS